MTSLSIATWNVNSVKSRLMHLLEWLRADKPDIVLLQELKCVEDAFPKMEIEDLGYNLAIYGEKTYNGVAILSKFPLEDITRGIPGYDDPRARYIEAVVSVEGRGSRGEKKYNDLTNSPLAPRPSPLVIRVASVYVPNGQEATSDKFQYKLQFLDHLHAHLQTLLSYQEILVVGGDYNIAPDDIDVHNPKEWEGSVLTHDAVRKRFRKTLNLGMYNALKLVASRQLPVAGNQAGDRRLETGDYSWWDYRNSGFERDNGLLIDHLLLSPQAADALESCTIEKSLRALEKPSDHTPVVGKFRL